MKHWKYLSYIVRHKWFVFLAGLRTDAPLWRLIVHDWSKFRPSEWLPYVRYFYGKVRAGERISVVADNAGFDGVVLKTRQGIDSNQLDCYIQPDNGSPAFWAWHYEVTRSSVERDFNVAWLRHQNRNPHHWQYWIITYDTGKSEVLPMPYDLIKEMVADWAGAGRAITGKWEVSKWYAENRDRMHLHSFTRLAVEELLAKHFPLQP